MNTPRRRATPLLLALAWLLAAPLSTHASATEAPARPNIVFIFSDDHALQAMGAYGSTINQKPHLDSIADAGVTFENSFCANSICGPSRASILTGKHSHLNGFRRNGNGFDGSQVTFPKLLQASGYQTALIGKWHLGTAPTGFDHWEILPGQGNYYNPEFEHQDGTVEQIEGYVTDLVAERSLRWLKEQRDPSKPFMLMCQQKAPHRNWSPPPRYYDLYKGQDIPEPDSLFDDYAGRSKLLKQNEMSIEKHFSWLHDMKFMGENQFREHFADEKPNYEYQQMTDAQRAAWDAAYEPENRAFLNALRAGELSDTDVTRWKYQRYIKDYLRCVQALDDSVGRVLDHLDEAGLSENTVVLQAIFPRGETAFDTMRLNTTAINDRIAKLADGDRVRFLDIGDRFVGPDGRTDPAVMPDALHLSPAGYVIWADALEPTLKELGL